MRPSQRQPRETWERKVERLVRELGEVLTSYDRELAKGAEEYRQQLNIRDLKAEAERVQRISEGTRRGLEKARRRGTKLGGPRRKPRIDPKKLRQLSGRGLSQQEIARSLGCSQPRVSQLLKKLKRTRR